jgi:hypothetical protein
MAERLNLDPQAIQAALQQLLDDKQVVPVPEQPGKFRSDECLLPMGSRAGWEAALLDQFQAMVRSMCIKLANGQTRALPDDEVGGSTYTFDIWPGHPREREVKALLKDTRQRLSRLWDAVTEENARHVSARMNLQRVTFYCGQSATTEEADLRSAGDLS